MKQADVLSKAVWGAAIMAAGLIWLLSAGDALSPVARDLLTRSAPALLIGLGLLMLLTRRMRLGGALAVFLTAALTVGVAAAAYSRQRQVQREDYRAPVEFLLPAEVTTLQIEAHLLATDVEIKPGIPGDRTVRGEFRGSPASLLSVTPGLNGAFASLTLTEAPRSAISLLDDVGRGTFTLFLPPDITLDSLTVRVEDGDLRLDTTGLSTPRLALRLGAGDLDVILSARSSLIADLLAGGGQVTVSVPSVMFAEIRLSGGGAGSPQFDAARYTFFSGDRVLVPKGERNAQLTLEGGTIVIR